ncbi:MAG: 16S rRNA (cytidine(1402)-2'-O)-methyltransferase [Alphaproteobacteria bacterium]|nr:16S rRNA (cytidine(1402)-2'-O)-methyltransferase [Alphaproteobacteria bacterium]
MFYSLYIVSTPIGNLKDISFRAIETLNSVDKILCEDTRISAKLLQNFGIKTPMMVYNDHNAIRVIHKVIDSILSQKETFALISDAGTPLVSDPGYKLVNVCIENRINFTVIPGASAVISALVLSGLPSDRFTFVGFSDASKFTELSKINSTLIFYEAPSRIVRTLEQMRMVFKNRTVVVVKEITKMYETSVRGDFDYVISSFKESVPKGEFVILLSPPTVSNKDRIEELLPLIAGLNNKISKKELSDILSKYSGLSKNTLYNYIMEHYND